MADNFPVNFNDRFRVEEDNFHVSRAVAIQAYASLEQALNRLFAMLTGLEEAVAGIIFFKIVNASGRRAILEKLKKRKLGAAHNLYFNALLVKLRDLDERRNQIVHWHEHFATEIAADGSASKPAILEPPNFWVFNDDTVTVTHADLIAFAYEVDFYTRSINLFTWHHDADSPMGKDAPWPDILAQPLVYPPPEDHPLYEPPPEPPNPPESSQA